MTCVEVHDAGGRQLGFLTLPMEGAHLPDAVVWNRMVFVRNHGRRPATGSQAVYAQVYAWWALPEERT